MIFPHGCVAQWRELCGARKTKKADGWAGFRKHVMALKGELDNTNRVGIARELAEIIYTAYDLALANDISLDAAFNETHRARLELASVDGKLHWGEDGEPLRPRNWSWPNMTPALGPARNQPPDARGIPRGLER